MESFELIDNFFQIVVLLCAAAAAGIFALRRRSRDLLILSLAYACFAMGTMYYVLYLIIIGIWPQVFYVAEILAGCVALLLIHANIADRGDDASCFAPCRSRGCDHCSGCFSRPRFWPVLFCFRTVCAYGGRDRVSLGVPHTARRLVSKEGYSDGHLCCAAGAAVSDF